MESPRRSGRQRVVSSRLEGMELYTKSGLSTKRKNSSGSTSNEDVSKKNGNGCKKKIVEKDKLISEQENSRKENSEFIKTKPEKRLKPNKQINTVVELESTAPNISIVTIKNCSKAISETCEATETKLSEKGALKNETGNPKSKIISHKTEEKVNDLPDRKKNKPQNLTSTSKVKPKDVEKEVPAVETATKINLKMHDVTNKTKLVHVSNNKVPVILLSQQQCISAKKVLASTSKPTTEVEFCIKDGILIEKEEKNNDPATIEIQAVLSSENVAPLKMKELVTTSEKLLPQAKKKKVPTATLR